MKLFIAYTSVIEALTGIGLLLFPVPLVSFLFGSPLTGPDGKIVAWIGGAAILSLSLLTWFLRVDAGISKAVKAMLIYNVLVALIFLFGILKHSLTGPGAWLALTFHFFQTIISLILLQKKQTYSIK